MSMQEYVSLLDSEEVLYLAIQASQQNQHDRAIALMKCALNECDRNRADMSEKGDLIMRAKLLYFLGAEYAEIGLHDRAVEHMREALEVDSTLTVCRFQLGLLLLLSGKHQEAETVWSLLEAAPYALFKEGLLALANNDVAMAKRALADGIEKNLENSSINKDMQSILDSLDSVDVAQDTEANEIQKRLLLSGYNKIQ